MKRSLILACLISFSLPALSQINKGTFALTTDFRFSSDQNLVVGQDLFQRNEDVSSFSASPMVQYFIANDLSLSFGLGYSRDKIDVDVFNNSSGTVTGNRSTTKSFLVNFQLRKYEMISEKFGLFLSFRTMFEDGKSDDLNLSNNDRAIADIRAYDIGISPGLILFLSDRIALDTSVGFLGYSYRQSKERDSRTETETKGFDTSLLTSTFSFGIQFFLNR